MADKNYEYFTANLNKLCENYLDRYVVIKNEAIIGDYASFDEAYTETIKTEKLGTFLIQPCVYSGDTSFDCFYSNNVVFA